MSQFVVGVTGGIGSGKTTVTNLFAQKGIEVVDADVIARQVVAPGSDGLSQIVDKFGGLIVTAKGELDRPKLREIIFKDSRLKAWLNALLHPLIREQMVQQSQAAGSVYCLLSVPLLVENNLQSLVNSVLVVDVDEQHQIERTMLRDDTDALQVRAIMQAQVSREERLAAADHIIDNNGDSTQLIEKVDELHQIYLALAESFR